MGKHLFDTRREYMKVDFEKSKTKINLARSFSAECMEGAKYQFMAKQAETENLAYLKSILKTLAKHEMSHAKVFWDYLQDNAKKVENNIDMTYGYPFECGELVDNFKFHSKNEQELSDHIYPAFAKIAKDEGYDDIAHSFKLIATVENCHSALLDQIYTKLKGKKLYKSQKSQKWKCNQCGFEHTAKQAWDTCPLCKYPQGYAEIPLQTD